LPPFLARPILALSARTGWLKALSWGMEIKTSSVAGYLRFHLLSRWRRFRQRSYRYAEDQQAIETWLALIVEDRSVRRSSPSRSSRVPDCSKGYGDTYRRGASNERIIETRVIRPVLETRVGGRAGIDAVARGGVARSGG
jgi:indolepyruvate ferredoxin oxidoreductase, beta subunit